MVTGRGHNPPAVGTPAAGGASEFVIGLHDGRASLPELSGAKAASLSRAAASGLPVLPGFVLTTTSFNPDDPDWTVSGPPEHLLDRLRSAWSGLDPDPDQPLVVRSSSTVEDIGESSMAGQFRSCLDVRGWDAFLEAVRAVLASSRGPAGNAAPAPMAVLVQRQVEARAGGVMFGLDPVTGNRSTVLVEAVPGGPESLVSGTASAQRYVLSRRGRPIETPDEQHLLDRRDCARLARLAARAARVFGGDQDVEWAIDTAGRLIMLQSRPVTAVGTAGQAHGPLLGPGPVGETFPDPLRPLEEDLWIPPLREGIESALHVVGAVPQRAVAASPVVTTLAGRVACDLELLGASPDPPGAWRWLDPRYSLRRAGSAWRVGRLRAVLPDLARDICRRVDTDLTEIGPLTGYGAGELLEIITRTREHLHGVHGHEILVGALLPDPQADTAATVAMSVVRGGRALGLSDGEIVERWPVALALTAPRVGADADLPPVMGGDTTGPVGPTGARVAALPAREALRLRARWLQELAARAATVLGQRLASQDRLPTAASLVMLTLDEVQDLVSGWPAPDGLADRAFTPGPPLPSCFRLSQEGTPIRVRRSGADRPGGRGAAEGRAQGRVVHDPSSARAGDILITRTLDPRLAGWLPTLGAVVSETGSVLSHLAILARECHVPTVVGVHDAVERYPQGSELVVDGTTGEVRTVDPPGNPGGDAP